MEFGRTIYFVCPHVARPCGGLRMIYRQVDILNSGGFSASVLHFQDGFRPDWFAHQTRITYMPVRMRRDDVLVFPELDGPSIVRTMPMIRKVIFNQNAYFTFKGCAPGEPDVRPPYLHESVMGAITVSEDNRRYLAHAFPNARIHRIRYSIDPALYHPESPKERQIAYMPRKNPRDAQEVIGMLRARGALRGFRVVPIDGLGQAEAAGILRRSAVILSFGSPEGFGLPAAEAMACGCVTVGYHGGGGREFFTDEHGFPIEFNDIVGYAQTVERVIEALDADAGAFDAMTRRASAFVLRTYSPENERAGVLATWGELLGAVAGGRGRAYASAHA